MSYPEIFPPERKDRPVSAVRTTFIDEVDRGAAQSIVDRLQRPSTPMAMAQLRVLGGAMARVPAEATAFAHRERRILANVTALYERPEERPTHELWVAGLAAALQSNDDGAYVGFLGDEGEARVREAYPKSTWSRLAAIKAHYDPGKLFRLNQNILPANEHGAAEWAA
jgi:hypothetical protein